MHWRKPGKVENGAVLSFGQSPLACGCCFTAKTLESVLPLMIAYMFCLAFKDNYVSPLFCAPRPRPWFGAPQWLPAIVLLD